MFYGLDIIFAFNDHNVKNIDFKIISGKNLLFYSKYNFISMYFGQIDCMHSPPII